MNATFPKEHELFLEALKLPPSEWVEFLGGACGDDHGLRQRLDNLLAAHREAGTLHRRTNEPSATTDHPNEQIGTLIGPYKLLEQIGEGGMGVVYVSEQTEPVRRRVALKIIKPGMDTKQVIARFEAERQALAMMDHPHIAKVLDAGTTDAGRPYFVMELVRGLPVTEYCDKARLSPRQRLELFIDVCHAVQHAHQKGVIHRDLKPSNVMITVHDGRPVAKVIDFGVAKAVGQQLTERTVYTAHTQLVGTPLYMSPEQADFSSQDVDTRSDVYSLGVLLYELLTGQTPFDKETLSKAGLDEMRRIIREDEPLRPSRRFSTLNAQAISTVSQHRSVDERHLGRVLRGELNWIVMKALEKDRSRRYESASALAADVQRYLSDEPVLACPPTTMYRFQKFARKHKPALFTAAAIALCLLLGTTVSAWQAIRATTAEANANANEAQAQGSAQVAKEKAQEAKAQAQEASAQRNEAQQQRDEAQRQRDEVKALNEELAATQTELREALYAAHMHLSHNAWQTGSMAAMQAQLQRYLTKDSAERGVNLPPTMTQAHQRYLTKPGEPDVRGFEWYFLFRICHSDLLTVRAHPERTPLSADVVNGVAYSPDGKQFASVSRDGTVRIWSATTGELLLSMEGGAPNLWTVAFSPDGKRIASGSKVWDAATGKEEIALDASARIFAFSPDGRRFAGESGQGAERSVRAWDTSTGQELTAYKGIQYVLKAEYSPDGKRLAATGGQRGRGQGVHAKVWDAETGDELPSPKGQVRIITFSHDGKRLAGVVWDDRPLKIWDAATGQEILSLTGPDGIGSVIFSPDGNRLAAAGGDKTIHIFDTLSGQRLVILKGHASGVNGIAYSPDGRYLASGSQDGTVKVWDAGVARGVVSARGGADRVWGIAFSPDGKRLASGDYDNTIRIWDAQTTPGAETGKDILVIKGHTKMVRSVAFSPDGKYLASGSLDNTVKLWNAETGKEIRTFLGHTGAVRTVLFSPTSAHLASASDDKTVKIWDIATATATLTLPGISPSVPSIPGVAELALAFSPDGKRLAAGCGESGTSSKEIKVWDVQTGNELLAKKEGNNLFALAFSPDGKYLARAGHRVKIWDSYTGQEVHELMGHNGGVRGLAFSPDGRRIATVGDNDRAVKIWNPSIEQETLNLTGHTDVVANVAFSPDGYRLATNGADGTVKIWDATPSPGRTLFDRSSASKDP